MAIIRNSPPGSALLRALGDVAQYTTDEMLSLATVRLLQVMSWQFAGDRKAAKPILATLPGMADESGEEAWRGKSMTVDEARERLGW